MERYCVFDLDGVLIDADELHRVALNRALDLNAQRPLTMEEHLTIYKGLPTQKKLDKLIALGRVSEYMRTAVARTKQEITLEEIRKLRVNSDKMLLLHTLRNTGWRLAVCSNAVRDSVRLMLEVGGYLPFLDFYLSNEDAPPKPDPGMYLKAAALFGVVSGNLVVVEDSAPGKASARAAGCRLVGVDGPEDVGMHMMWRLIAEAETVERKRRLLCQYGCSSCVGSARTC